jgi:glutaredoxin-like YruB-family protein
VKKMSIIVYTSTNCPYCMRVKNLLKQNKVEFVEINIENDSSMAFEVVQKTGQMSVPVTDINGKLVVGFNKEAILGALGN